MRPGLLTKQVLVSWGGEEVYEQARRMVQRGQVVKCDVSGDLIEGVELRPGMSEIRTRVRIHPDGSVESLCPCITNQRDGQICPHIVALGITVMMRTTDPLRAQKYAEEQRRAKRIEQIASSAYLPRRRDGLPVRLCLSLPGGWQGTFHAQGKIQLALFLLAEGRPPMLPEMVPAGTAVRLSATDENLLEVLEDICEGPAKGHFEVSPPDFVNLIQNAGGAKILEAGFKEYVAEGRRVSSALEMDVDPDTGELYLFPHADIPSLPPGVLPSFFVSGRQGVVLAEGRFWTLANVLPLPYHSIYVKDEVIPRENVITFLERDLPNLLRQFPVKMDLSPDLFERVPGKPVFTVELNGSRASLSATLRADYGGHSVVAGVRDSVDFAIPDPDDILRYAVRNLPAEKSALTALGKVGFKETDGRYEIVGTREVLNFLGTGMPTLGRLGWKVKPAPKLEAILDELPVLTPVVKISESDRAGWFDVGYTFERPGAGRVSEGEVQSAINRGDAFLKTADGICLLDSNAVESMRSVFNDCQSRESPLRGHFLLPRVYAPFVQASLHAMDGMDVEEPPDWREKAARHNREKGTRFAPVPLGDGLEEILRPYQKEGVYWLRFLENAGMNGLLADEMGLGKTLQTLTWLSLPRTDEEARGRPAIVICPTSLVANWDREAAKFLPRFRRLVINGPNREGLFAKIPESDLVITSYALVRRDLGNYAPYRFSVAVLDEAQHIKNRTTQNAIAVKKIYAGNKLVLTGTPIENGVQDIWSIMDFLMPDYLGSYDSFRVNYEDPLSGASPEDAAPLQSKLRHKLHPFILRRVKKDVAKDLPDKLVKIQYCTMTDDQKRVYDEILFESQQKVRGMVKEKGFEKSRFEILAILMRLRQVCCHLDLLQERKGKRADERPSAKLEAFFELLDEAVEGGHRILVFSQFVRMLSLIRAELETRGVPYCYLDGSTKDRLEQCQRFNLTPSIPVFLISLKAGGTGLNLTGADMVIHFDPWWNPAVEDQATDRAHRIGQKKTVYSIKLIAEDSVEERVLAMQRRKQALISATIESSDSAIMSKLSFDDLKDLLSL
ncbi:MAG: SNF2 helicase associated domain-containing protein [Kiritimatiellae bacterium]|nr:SNF2 helicase associated domain-containing protein [Kiritimatiellia bacterium]